uniref:Lea/Rab family small GTPase n=1 Tax=Sinohyriopsis cumingii TaxID=165450 RepID=E1B4V3_SINCU|nr:Lea/Rab family small GTPase [Sinohyriopsis cumingii]
MPQHSSQKRFSSLRAAPKFKAVLLGDVGVGKSSLFLRIKDDVFDERLQSTVGIESCLKSLYVDRAEISFQIWDTAGVEKFQSLSRSYYRNTQVVLLVYSVHDSTSLQRLTKWIKDTEDHSPNAMKFLIGNKCDQEKSVSDQSAHNFAATHECADVFLTSAKTGEGIDQALVKITEQLLNSYQRPFMMESPFACDITSTYEDSISLTKDKNNNGKKDRSCCF